MSFSVTRLSKTIVRPSEPTPPGKLNLSIIDRLPQLRCNIRTLHVFRHGHKAAEVIREALSKALVPYYPLAGRLEDSSDGELQVSCTGEGVWFVEASADCNLDAVNYLNDYLKIPQDDLLPESIPETESIDPIVLMQVTSFKCQGFVIGLTFSHSICDGLGAAQFLNAVGEFARGLLHPSIKPVWFREALSSPTQPNAMKQPKLLPPPMLDFQLEHVPVDIPAHKIDQLKHEFFELTGKTCSTFDVVVASIWSSRNQAINLDKGSIVKLVFLANTRPLLNPPLPEGFYGNCFFPIEIKIPSGWLMEASHAEVVKLIKDAKAGLPIQFTKWMESYNDLENGEDSFGSSSYNTLFISEWGRLGFNQIDYGWGHPVHIVPIQGAHIIPVCIVGLPPAPETGIRLMTWCVKDSHLPNFLDQMKNLRA